MNEADNQQPNPAEADAASAQAPQIPKWRLDEALAKLRAREEELQAKDQLLNRFAPQQQQPQGPTAEELNLDPQTLQSVQRLAGHMIEQRLRQAEGPIKNMVAGMRNELEETKFLLNQGKEKSKYLDKIKEQRQRHFQMTGGYQSVDDAYKIVMYDELMAAQTKRQATPQPQQAQPQHQTQVQAQAAPLEFDDGAGGVPDVAQTRASATPGAAKTFDQLSLDEQEAYLERQMAGQNIQL